MPDFAGFVGGAYKAPSIYQDAQECINWYAEVDSTKAQGERGVLSLYPTPGLTPKVTGLPVGEVRALYTLSGGLGMLAVVSSAVYLVNSALVATLVGGIASTAGSVSICDNGIVAYLVDGLARYVYTIATGDLVGIADGAFTGGDRCDEVDTFIVYNKPGSNQWAATSPLSRSTPALSFSSKDGGSGNIVTLIADHREVFLLGEKDTEVWVNVGAFPFPFQRIPGTSLQHGCAAKHSVARLGESIAWLSQDTRGQAIVIMLVGYQPKRLTTHAVEADIKDGYLKDAVAFSYQQGGHEFYVLNLPTQDKTWVYDLASDEWHKRAYRDSSNVLHRHRANCHAMFLGMNLVGDYANGIIYQLDQSAYTDNGDPILRLRRTPHITHDLRRVFYELLQLQFEPGVGLTSGQGSTPKVMLRWSDDGGSTWSNVYLIDIGAMGQFKNRAIKRKMGWARDRVYEVSITDPVKAVIVSAEIVTSTGGS